MNPLIVWYDGACPLCRREIALIRKLARAMSDHHHNYPPLPGFFPGYFAPIIRHGAEDQREMADVYWGMPSSRKALREAAEKREAKLRAKGQEVDFHHLLRMEPDKGITNVRNTNSAHWRPWLGPANRCLVPFTSFCEPDHVGGTLQNTWFAFDHDRPLAFFAGI